MPLSREKRQEHFAALTRRRSGGRHDDVRTNIFALLTQGLDMDATLFHEEHRVVGGRADTLLGQTVFEYKSDLRRETADVEAKLPDYLRQVEERYGGRFVGIATDGILYRLYERTGDQLQQLGREFNALERVGPGEDAAERLVAWLKAAVSPDAQLLPEPEVVRLELGRESPAYARAEFRLRVLWEQIGQVPDVQLKRQLWAQQLERVYGSSVDSDSLFFQHTYLTIVAKTMATAVVGLSVDDPADLLSGRAFNEAGIHGAVESDFFDWVLESRDGERLVSELQHHVSRFRLQDVKSDVLKGLYESLIDPEQRHDLGEYYTPDWLAARICERAIADPVNQRVLDPACGSGTFAFHAVQRFLAAADAAGMSNAEALVRVGDKVHGIDIHPVAVIIAKVTYLLALGSRLRGERGQVHVPIYLGDSLQWNTAMFMAEREVLVDVPNGPTLHLPFPVARQPNVMNNVIDRLLDLCRANASPDDLPAAIAPIVALAPPDLRVLQATYEALLQLFRTDRDHIWGFILTNVVRPVWLSQDEQKADVVLGNPPWLAYRHMRRELQTRFREECDRRGIWVGDVAQQSDLSAYFFARSVELYLKPSGTIAFVMPFASMSRRQFSKFRRGIFGSVGRRKTQRAIYTAIRFLEGWVMSDDLQPLFPVPSCVLFAGFEGTFEEEPRDVKRRPDTVTVLRGLLPRRDATVSEADAALKATVEPWPSERTGRVKDTHYSTAFRQGAILIPRVLWHVDRVQAGSLGENRQTPRVASRRSPQEKAPWKNVATLEGPIEAEFLKPMLLGESIAPFRVMSNELAVIPWSTERRRLLDAAGAQSAGQVNLARWMRQAEQAWSSAGTGRRALLEQLDYYGQLTAQFPVPRLRVVYAASGTVPAACVLRDTSVVLEHSVYWSPAASEGEGLYLAAILSSETARARVEQLQARGQWGARHFDKVMFELPIPKFDPAVPVHARLAEAGARAEQVAASAPLPERGGFRAARAAIRNALKEDGVGDEIDRLVAELLDSQT